MSEMQKKFNEWFSYKEKTGELFWKKSSGNRAAGAKVGALDTSFDVPRIVLKLDNAKYHLARVIWCMHHGDIEKGMVIDHINGDPLDNRLSNLRLTTPSGNARNRRISSTNTSGATGVQRSTKGKPWRAQIWKDGTFCHLGVYNTKKEAVAARTGAEKALGYLTHKRASIRGTGKSRPDSSHR